VADDEVDAVADELVGDRDALLGIGNVVALLELDFLAENAASLVEVLNRLSDAVGQLRAERGVRAGDRAGDANLICASAVPAKPRPAASTRPVNQYFFILRSLCLGRRQRPEAETIPP
jgi:hypothetical protein